jgi:hypothetical protein
MADGNALTSGGWDKAFNSWEIVGSSILEDRPYLIDRIAGDGLLISHPLRSVRGLPADIIIE